MLSLQPTKNIESGNLLARKLELSLMNEIPDMGAYAQSWADLAAEFELIGFPANAEDCKARAIHYAEIAIGAPGAYVREQCPPFVDLIPLAQAFPF